MILRFTNGKLFIAIRVQANRNMNKLMIENGTLIAKVTATPHDNKANKGVMKLLKKHHLHGKIVYGITTQHKIIELNSIDRLKIEHRLNDIENEA